MIQSKRKTTSSPTSLSPMETQ